jgi:hypothetical protein
MSDPVTGIAEVYITSNEPGTFSATAKIGTTAIGSYAVVPNNRDAQFGSGEPDAANSSRTVSPDTDATPSVSVKADGNETFVIEATIKSAFGTKVENATVRLVVPNSDVTLVGDVQGLTGLPTSDHYGTFTWTAKSIKAATVTDAQIQVRVTNALTGLPEWVDVGAPVKLNFVAGAPVTECLPSATVCTNYSIAPVTQEAGADVVVTVLVTDENGNPVAGSRVTLESAPGGTFGVPSTHDADGNPITGADGTVTISLTDTTVRVDTVRAKLGAQSSIQYISEAGTELLAEADRIRATDVTFTAGAVSVGPFDCEPGKTGTSFHFDPLTIALSRPTPDTLDGSSTGWVKVTDAFCNPIEGAVVTFSKLPASGLSGLFDPASGTVTTAADGTATITLTEDMANTDLVLAVVEGMNIAITGTEVVNVTPVTVQAVEFFNPAQDSTPPVVDPTNGTVITGTAGAGATVTVTDEQGNPIPGCESTVAGADGKFSCKPTTVLENGATIYVTATTPGDYPSAPTKVTVGAIGGVLSPAKLYRGDTMTLQGFNFGPGEKVTVVCNSTAFDLGTFAAGQNGQVIVGSWQVPADIEIGQHICTFTGAQSGPVSVPFQVLEPLAVFTGGSIADGNTPNPGISTVRFVAYLARAKRPRGHEQ